MCAVRCGVCSVRVAQRTDWRMARSARFENLFVVNFGQHEVSQQGACDAPGVRACTRTRCGKV